MTLARLPRDPPDLETALLVAGSVRFVAGVSAGHSPTAGTAAGSSTATTAALFAGTPRCNNAPSDAPAENSSRTLSANTAGSAAGVLSLSSFVGFVDFFEKLKDLDWGSWERLLPEGSSLGAGMPLLSEAPFILSLCRRPFSAFASAELYQTSFIVLTAKRPATLAAPFYAATRQWRTGSHRSATVVSFFAATDTLRTEAH